MWDYMHQNRKLLPIAAVFTAVILFLILWSFVFHTPAYSVYLDGEKKFAVKDPQVVDSILKKIEKKQEEKQQKDLELSTKIEFKRSIVSRDTLLTAQKLEKELDKTVKYQIMAAVVVVNGKELACLNSKDEAQKLLKSLKENNQKLEEGEKLLKVTFEEDVKIKEKKVPASKLVSYEDAYTLITTGTDNPEKYVVKEGDSLWLIARRNDMYVDDIVQVNHLDSELLQPGDELILVKSKPYINVLAEVEGEKVEQIPYETKIIVDKNAPTSIRVKQAGKNGEKRIVYVATKRNGVTQDREVKEETILKEAVTKILVKGNQVTVASRSGGGSGKLSWPVYGTITSPYGARGGRHTGMDIAARTGTPIKAADSGYVTYTGWRGGYGKFVIVDHGNGIVTRYAHCNSIYVSVGQKVNRGDPIASVGSTGNSSGPHLHFETLVYGSFRNPASYLR